MNAQQLKQNIAQTINKIIRSEAPNKIEMVTEIFPKELSKMLDISEVQAQSYVYQVAKEIEGAI